MAQSVREAEERKHLPPRLDRKASSWRPDSPDKEAETTWKISMPSSLQNKSETFNSSMNEMQTNTY